MRPASAAQLAASLPGGDPLAAAIAAGETPSPELVAASGLKEGLTPAVAAALLAVVVVGSLATVWLNDRVGLVPNAKPSKAPDAMVERARAVLAKAGYTDDARDSGFGFYVDDDVIRYVIDQRPVEWRSGDLRSLGAVRFYYRHSPVPLVSPGFGAGIEPGDPPLQREGDIEVRLDGDGRLRSFEAIPVHGQASQKAEPDWSGLFSEAGFESAAWRSVEPQQVPRSYADTRVAWEGDFSADRGTPARIEAAAYEGRPVAFAVVGPWKPHRSSDDVRSGGGATLAAAVTRLGTLAPLLAVVVFLVGAFFARRNLRYGRGDRRGATRLSVFGAAMFAVAWLFTEHHVTSPAEGFLFLVAVGVTVSAASFVWIFYTAVEPFIRRRWPQILVAWARVLAGNWRDPLVGRDALIGCAAGVLSACLTNLVRLVAWERGQATLFPADWNMFNGTRPFIGALATQISLGIFISVLFLFAFFVLRIVLRHDWAAIGLFVIFSGGLRTLAAPFSWATIPAIVVSGAVRTFVLVRIGLVAAMVDGFVWTLFMSSPMTLQTSAWYAGAGYVAFAVVGAIAAYGFSTALGGRLILDGAAVAD